MGHNILLEALEIIAKTNIKDLVIPDAIKIAQTAIDEYWKDGSYSQTDEDNAMFVIRETAKMYSDGKTPADDEIMEWYKQAYDKLFGYRDSHQTVLSAPQRHNLVEVFKELKFGRPAEDQKFLQKCIEKLSSEKEDEIKSYKDFYGLLNVGKGTFGMAIEALKHGKRVARKGWNGKGMWLKLVNMQEMDASPDCPEIAWTDKFINLPTIAMKTADEKLLFGWLASQTDMLAEDWVILE
jgi:hypothetical protein